MSLQPATTLLFGVGLGPGDPDSMTVRARDIILSADRLVHFCKRGRRGHARRLEILLTLNRGHGRNRRLGRDRRDHGRLGGGCGCLHGQWM